MEPDHLTPADVFGFIEGELDPVWLELVWEHLDGCEECVRYVAQVLGAHRPATAEEEAVLSRLPQWTLQELLKRLQYAKIPRMSTPMAVRCRRDFTLQFRS